MKEYSIHIYDDTMKYNSMSDIDVGKNIKLDIWGKDSISLPITNTKVINNKFIKITFEVPKHLYKDFVNSGENDFYDIHLEHVMIDNIQSWEWVW